jgi:hypothetical protein
MTTPRVNRRRFVEALAIAAGSVAATALCPSIGQAAPRAVMASRLAPYAKTGPLTDWTIDDMTALSPRYAQAIGCSRSRAGLVHSDPLDHL